MTLQLLNNELESTKKKHSCGPTKEPPWNLLGRTEENHKSVSSELTGYLKPGPPKHKAHVLITQPQYLVMDTINSLRGKGLTPDKPVTNVVIQCIGHYRKESFNTYSVTDTINSTLILDPRNSSLLFINVSQTFGNCGPLHNQLALTWTTSVEITHIQMCMRREQEKYYTGG
jgi:hypothetical protein